MIEHTEGSCRCDVVRMGPCGFCENNGATVWCRICRSSATVIRPEEEGEMLQCGLCEQIAPFCEWLDQAPPSRPIIIIQDETAALFGARHHTADEVRRWAEGPLHWLETPRQRDKPALTDAIADLIDRPCHGPECRRTVPESSASEDFCSADCERNWRAANNGVRMSTYGEPIIPEGHPAEATAQLPDHLPDLDGSRPSENWPAALPEANAYDAFGGPGRGIFWVAESSTPVRMPLMDETERREAFEEGVRLGERARAALHQEMARHIQDVLDPRLASDPLL